MAKRIQDPWSAGGKLTDALVAALTPPATGNKIRWDGAQAGFGCRVTAAGAKAFVYRYRNKDGRDRTFTIGDANSRTVALAAKKARELCQMVENGHDPLQTRQDDRTAPTVADLAERYREDAVGRMRASTLADLIPIIDQFVIPGLGNKKLGSLSHDEVKRWHKALGERSKVRANHAVAYLHAMFEQAIKLGWCASNPCRGIAKFKEHPRERYLTADETGRLMAALNAYPERLSAQAIKLIMYTGARIGETLNSEWSQFDLAAGVWTKPHGHTKQNKTHRAPLSGPAIELLRGMKRVAAPGAVNVFPSTRGRLVEVRKTWRRACKAAGITEVRIHDLRHSYASVLASAGLSLPVIGALLGHSSPATTARYAHLTNDALRDATEAAGAIISGKVVPFSKAKHKAA